MTSTRDLGERLEEIGKRLRELDLSDSVVKRLDEEIGRLDELIAEPRPKTHGVLEWWGVGKGFWRKMDVDEYIRKERASWR
jgi:hypothetical protein